MTILDVGMRAVIAREVMSSPTLTVTPDASLWEAWRLMMQSGLRHLVVCDGEGVAGVIDDRTVFAQWPMGPLALRRSRVGEVMSPRTTCVEDDADLQTVAAIMSADGVDAVPVIDADRMVVGIVTKSDLTAAVAAYGMWRLA